LVIQTLLNSLSDIIISLRQKSKTEDRRQRTDDRGQRMENRGQETDGRGFRIQEFRIYLKV
jgi:hypothetical protein